jgi:hypothetical protein
MNTCLLPRSSVPVLHAAAIASASSWWVIGPRRPLAAICRCLARSGAVHVGHKRPGRGPTSAIRLRGEPAVHRPADLGAAIVKAQCMVLTRAPGARDRAAATAGSLTE